MREARFDNLYEMLGKKGKRIFTKSAYPEFKGFDETIIRKEGKTYREIDPKRSKLFAGIKKGLSQTGIRNKSSILYLGASHGYTPSFVSDLVGKEGFVFCVDVAPRVVRDLFYVCEERSNMLPILANCRQPETYKEFIPKDGVDVIFQDIAQKDQTNIFFKNIDKYLKKGGFAILALKARSIDVTTKPRIIFDRTYKELTKRKDLVLVDKRDLAPLEMDHMLYVVKKK